MPIFKFLCDYINREQDNRKLMTDDDVSSKPGGGGGQKKKTDNNYQPWQKKANVVETAAATSSTTTTVENSNSKLYSGEVVRTTANIMVKDAIKNKEFPYLAVDKLSKICPRCYPEDGNLTNPCERKCYQNKCVKCGYYGHKMSTCLQSHKISGEKIDR
mmetsp:Transcript_12495/g.17091  ORF Transcript_12495/g.17091 Transcript_12495/m.17091 type:complete len:159 (+) Transcript_12495:1216-1692(+)